MAVSKHKPLIATPPSPRPEHVVLHVAPPGGDQGKKARAVRRGRSTVALVVEPQPAAAPRIDRNRPDAVVSLSSVPPVRAAVARAGSPALPSMAPAHAARARLVRPALVVDPPASPPVAGSSARAERASSAARVLDSAPAAKPTGELKSAGMGKKNKVEGAVAAPTAAAARAGAVATPRRRAATSADAAVAATSAGQPSVSTGRKVAQTRAEPTPLAKATKAKQVVAARKRVPRAETTGTKAALAPRGGKPSEKRTAAKVAAPARAAEPRSKAKSKAAVSQARAQAPVALKETARTAAKRATTRPSTTAPRAKTAAPPAKSARPSSRAAVTRPSRRNAGPKAGAKAPAKQTTARAAAPAKGRTAVRDGRRVVSARRPVAPPPLRVIKVRELDPYARCGPDTSVEQLFRVDESLDGRPTVHVVYLDRHGWYCYHGRTCPAVADVHRELRSQGRTATRARA